MFPIDTARAVAVMPAPSAPGTAGYFTDGNAGTGVPATILPAEFLNMIMVEMINLVTAGGLTPAKNDYTQVASAVKKIVSASQVGVVGQSRNLVMNVGTASATATVTADEVIVETALGGLRYCLANFNATINLATVGVGGMDTGAAPSNGFVGIYAITNPTSGAKGLLAVNATAAKAPEVYGGANMPSGYTASALVSVRPTNALGQFLAGQQVDRELFFPARNGLTTSTQNGSGFTSFSIASVVPRNASKCRGSVTATTTTAATMALYVSSDSNGSSFSGVTSGPVTQDGSDFQTNIIIPQTLYYQASVGAGTPAFVVSLIGYTF